jgi:hypothetical protein
MDSMYLKRSDIIAQLRGAKGDLAPYMRPGQTYVDIKHVDMRGLTADQIRCNEVQVCVYNGITFLRATYGHKGEVAARMNYGQYVSYRGSADIFCVTHFSLIGLGEINHTRHVNILSTPDITPNKGCIGYISVSQARLRGIEFWSKVGDRHGNKIACFDPEIRECFHNIKYVDTYGSEESLLRTHSGAIANYSRFLSPERALQQAKRLFIEDNDESGDESNTETIEFVSDDEMDDLSSTLESVVIMA